MGKVGNTDRLWHLVFWHLVVMNLPKMAFFFHKEICNGKECNFYSFCSTKTLVICYHKSLGFTSNFDDAFAKLR